MACIMCEQLQYLSPSRQVESDSLVSLVTRKICPERTHIPGEQSHVFTLMNAVNMKLDECNSNDVPIVRFDHTEEIKNS